MRNLLLLTATVLSVFCLGLRAQTCAPGQKCYGYGGHPQYDRQKEQNSSSTGVTRKNRESSKTWVRGHFGVGRKGKKQWIAGHWETTK